MKWLPFVIAFLIVAPSPIPSGLFSDERLDYAQMQELKVQVTDLTKRLDEALRNLALRQQGTPADSPWGPNACQLCPPSPTSAPVTAMRPVTDADRAGASRNIGLTSGHIAIGPRQPHAFVGLQIDETYINVGQEVRGVHAVVRNHRSTPDEGTLGWDFFGMMGAVVARSDDGQYIRGNQKAVVGELYFDPPPRGSYAVRMAHNFQAASPQIGQNVTLERWFGLVVNPPVGQGEVKQGYGILIGPITKPETRAAIKIDGTDDSGQIAWGGASISQGSHGGLELGLNRRPLSLAHADVVQPAASAVGPTRMLQVSINGELYRIPLYPLTASSPARP